MLQLILILVCSQLIATSSRASAKPAGDELVGELKESCLHFEARVKSLSDLKKFHNNFEQIASPQKNRKITGAETGQLVCFQHGILFKTVDRLSRLAERLHAANEYICTAEYATRIYRLHRTLEATYKHNTRHHLMSLLSELVSGWMQRCTSSLNQRLMDTEKRAPDALRHLNFILGILRFQVSPKMARAFHPPVDIFVPVLETEMLNESDLPTADTYQFKITKTQKLAFESAWMSCSSLKLYFVNILGSLGLVSSLGYGAPVVDRSTLSARQQQRQQDWLLAALMCQSLGTVSRVSSRSTADKNTFGILVGTLRKPDVSLEDERDTTFAGFRLSEQVSPTDTTPVAGPQHVASESSNVARLRKLQLIEGPTKYFANAVMQYLDMNQLEREKLPYNLLGLEPPAKLGDDDEDEADDDDDDDDDDDNEEEEDDDNDDE